jgi:hypothetical protein
MSELPEVKPLFEHGLIENLKALTRQGEDYIWRTAQAALTAIENRDKDIKDLRQRLEESEKQIEHQSKAYGILCVELNLAREDSAAFARDAGRYRWLREQDWFDGSICVLRNPKRVLTQGVGLGADCPSHDRLDQFIDAAIAAEGASND